MNDTITNTEPALSTSTATSLITAGLAVLVSFGLGLSDDQKLTIVAFFAVAAPLIAGLITRSKVTPSSQVVTQVTSAGRVVAGEAAVEPNGSSVEFATQGGGTAAVANVQPSLVA